MPRGNVACDDCVPRGCSCNCDLKEGIDIDSPEAQKPENWIEATDEQGRKFPCCEWWYCPEGIQEDEYPADILQKSYEEAKAEGRVIPIEPNKGRE